MATFQGSRLEGIHCTYTQDTIVETLAFSQIDTGIFFTEGPLSEVPLKSNGLHRGENPGIIHLNEILAILFREELMRT